MERFVLGLSEMSRHDATVNRLPLGTAVYDAQDPRFVGELVAVTWSSTARVRWLNGWVSDIPVSRIREATLD